MAFLPDYWVKLRRQHSVLGVFGDFRETQAFSCGERCLCLGMGLGCTWISVFVKHAVKATRAESIELPEGLGYHVDSLICGVSAGVLNVLIGKSLVKMVLKKDWDQSKGIKGQISTLATAWASILTFGSLAHLVFYCLSASDEVTSKVIAKWAHSVFMHMFIVEPMNIAASVAFAVVGAQLWERLTGRKINGPSGDLETPLLR
mmetsp:Transcript_58797/g.149220  ORF Transcript_58797/g.149220 Transcript_58797/m.149220 type:complete len:203 (-) Transcript_58797:394-1002(-)|eukprot:CAMPEP_0183397042 /NCGR_PEP_ID=MMETSP0370-20130417/10334_1 /TAXON_ID=268820 /ORGANISM="Peridinium aciculiferum, Strain PAER-2" /LENGTH=202 /DNA_ID=CAMNT_0025577867 /DNA_START=53 /DNA_END=661 /DNA_ORIENTATION=+